ncbi:PAS domain S-box protein [Polyangium sp. y55x31]|uniref:PAS domain S-box protein n=1 Tax=Polyangium sp. y55x31 TaxID=3042688 RepID=UPI002482B7E6|nr:PAS domain S-box protein [Polyangium sp. y55x31]MDI1480159.1 PAS domain S-box protein [Polyangium sp. y55x31]
MAGADKGISFHQAPYGALAARLLGPGLEPKDAHQLATELVASALGADVTLFYVPSEDGFTLVVSAHHGAPEALLARVGSLPLESAALAAQVARTRSAMAIDGEALDRPFDVTAAAELGCGPRALAVPLVAEARELGVLVCFLRQAEHGRDRTLPMLSALAAFLAVSLASARPASAEVERKNQKYRGLFQNAFDGFLVADDEGHLVDVNPRACELFCATRDELLQRTVFDLRPPEIGAKLRETWGAFLASGRKRAEGPFRRVDGSTFAAEFTAQAHFVPGRHVAIIRDVSTRKRAEDALRRSQERLARAQRIAQIGSWEWELETNELFWSDECYRLFGLTPAAGPMTYEAFLALVHPDDRANVDEAVRCALRGTSRYAIDHRIIAADGQPRIVHEECDVIRDEAGRPLRMCGTVRDVTDQRRAEMALQKSEALFRQVLETLPVGVWVADEHGKLVLVNPAGLRIWGGVRFIGPEQFGEYKAWWVDTGKEIAAEEWAIARAVRNGETSLNELIEIQAFDGTRRILVNSAAPVRDPEGRILGAFAINDDVTEQRRAEMALQKSERLLRQVLETLPVGVWVIDEHGTILLGNPAGQRVWAGARYVGIEQYDIFKGWWVDTGKPITPEEWGAARAVRKGETSLNELIEIETLDGTRKIILHSAAPVRDDEGRILGAVVVNEDVTERRRLEAERERLVQALSMEQRWLRTVIDHSPIGIVLCKVGAEPAYLMNQKAEELMGASMPTDVRHLLQQRLHQPDGSPLAEGDLSLDRALRGEVVTGRELLIRAPHELDVPVLTNASPIRSEGGQLLGAVVTYEDITPLKELERLRQEWTSVVAHDLRQPVTTILMLAGGLARSGADAAARTRGERIVGSAARLSRMIGDLLDLSRMEAHRLELLRAPTDVPALLARVIEASGSRERVMLSIHGELPTLFVDPQRIEQVAENLLSNAIKYGEPGTPIEILSERRGDEVVVKVRNQGPGITAEDMRTLFERFQRGGAKGSAIKGLGLGLYIVRGLVEAHGGRIEARSVPGETTTFSFSLPIEAGPAGAVVS